MIRSIYGVSVAQNLIAIEASDDDPCSSVFKMSGLISDSNYIAKKITMVLFINGMSNLHYTRHAISILDFYFN